MHQIRRDTYSILSNTIFRQRRRTTILLTVTLLGLLTVFNPGHFQSIYRECSAVPDQTGTSSYASASSTGQLDLSNPNINASRNSAYSSSWSSNSTSAQTTINSSDPQGETVSMVWRLNQTVIAQAQIIKYDFGFATHATVSGSSAAIMNATIGLTSSNYQGWYTQSRTPIYPNNTETVSISNAEQQYSNGSQSSSLLFVAQQVTNAQSNSPENNAVLFQREFPGIAAGDGVLHHYTIEIDTQSDRTIWIMDNTVIATYQLSFVPSNLEFTTFANGLGDSAKAVLRDPVQTPTLSVATGIVTIGPGQFRIGNITSSPSQISSLQNQINQLNNRVGNLTSQNTQLQAKTEQWVSQWWAGIIWGGLGAGLVASLFVTEFRLRTRGRKADSGTGAGSTCSQCGGAMPPGATFCGECGTQMTATSLDCPECGQQMPAKSAYCGDCGRQISVSDPSAQETAHTSMSADPNEKEGSWR